jgi:predicted methyltransferase
MSLSARILIPAFACLCSFSVLGQEYTIPAATPAHIVRGVESPERTTEMIERDPARKPAEVLALAGLAEGDHVAELGAFGQYYSTILSAAIGPQGQLDMYDLPFVEAFGAIPAGEAFRDAHANTTYKVTDFNGLDLGTGLDAVYIILFYHDLGGQMIDTPAMNKAIFAALKPGGTYLVVDHRAEDGAGWSAAGTVHRIDKQTVIEEVQSAGFVLAADSNLLAHPEDDKSQRVFAPGTRGGTDRMVLVFRKPQ